MTGKRSYFEDRRPYSRGYVTFGDGGKGEILGIGNLINDELEGKSNEILE